MTSPRYKIIDTTEGTGEVLSRGECVAKVDYSLRTRQELPSVGNQQGEGRRLIDGHVLVREGERQLRDMGPLVLRMQDGREVTFLADLGNPSTGAFSIKVSGNIRGPKQ